MQLDANIWIFVLVGFLAQMIDGCLGMAYGVSANSFLLAAGVPPAAASASVHTAEVFTTAVSGISHWHMGNVDRALLRKLIVPGVLGGALGAYILASLPGDILKPWIAVYLLAMGLRVLWKARNLVQPAGPDHARLPLLALTGGFFDAIGGGGWGPIVTSTLLARGNNPRKTIGSVNLSEFFVTLVQSITFFVTLGIVHWRVIVGLIIGGVLAAPLGAYLCKRLTARRLMVIVGLLIVVLSIRTLALALM